MQYYKPWELRTEEQDRIEKQIQDAEFQIEREVDSFEEQKRKWTEDDGGVNGSEDAAEAENVTPNRLDEDGAIADPEVDAQDLKTEAQASTNGGYGDEADDVVDDALINDKPVDVTHSDQEHVERDQQGPHDQHLPLETRSSIDDTGDAMLDGGEDTVMY